MCRTLAVPDRRTVIEKPVNPVPTGSRGSLPIYADIAARLGSCSGIHDSFSQNHRSPASRLPDWSMVYSNMGGQLIKTAGDCGAGLAVTANVEASRLALAADHRAEWPSVPSRATLAMWAQTLGSQHQPRNIPYCVSTKGHDARCRYSGSSEMGSNCRNAASAPTPTGRRQRKEGGDCWSGTKRTRVHTEDVKSFSTTTARCSVPDRAVIRLRRFEHEHDPTA